MSRWGSVSTEIFGVVLQQLPMSLKKMSLSMDVRDSLTAQPALLLEVNPFTKHDWQNLKFQLETILNKDEPVTQKISVIIMPGSRGVNMTDRFTRYSLVIRCHKG